MRNKHIYMPITHYIIKLILVPINHYIFSNISNLINNNFKLYQIYMIFNGLLSYVGITLLTIFAVLGLKGKIKDYNAINE